MSSTICPQRPFYYPLKSDLWLILLNMPIQVFLCPDAPNLCLWLKCIACLHLVPSIPRHILCVFLFEGVLSQWSHRTCALELCQKPRSICGHIVKLPIRISVSKEELKKAANAPARNSCLFNLAHKVSTTTFSPGLYSTHYVPHILCPTDMCLKPLGHLNGPSNAILVPAATNWTLGS